MEQKVMDKNPDQAPAHAPEQPATAQANVPQGDAPAADQKPAPESKTVKEIEVDGYKFKVDMDLMDDIEAFGYIDRIENNGQISAIVPLLKYLVGEDGVKEMTDFFKKKYGKFRLTKLMNVYEAIAAKFDPKG